MAVVSSQKQENSASRMCMSPESILKKSVSDTDFRSLFSLVQRALVKENPQGWVTNLQEIEWL
jgi:hypothetical protein